MPCRHASASRCYSGSFFQPDLFSSYNIHIRGYIQDIAAVYSNLCKPPPIPPFFITTAACISNRPSHIETCVFPSYCCARPAQFTDRSGTPDTMNDNNMGNGDEPPGDGGGGAAVPELPLAQVVSDVLASPAPVTFRGERVTPTRVSPRDSS